MPPTEGAEAPEATAQDVQDEPLPAASAAQAVEAPPAEGAQAEEARPAEGDAGIEAVVPMSRQVGDKVSSPPPPTGVPGGSAVEQGQQSADRSHLP